MVAGISLCSNIFSLKQIAKRKTSHIAFATAANRLGLTRLIKRALSSTFVVKDLNKNERNIFQISVNNTGVHIAAKMIFEFVNDSHLIAKFMKGLGRTKSRT